MFNEEEIKKAISILKPNGQLFEVRMIDGKWNNSGYFTNVDKLIEELNKTYIKPEATIYITLNSIKDACYSRKQKDKFIQNVNNTTTDDNIQKYQWLFIDLDPKRPSGVSSSDEELEFAKNKANEVYLFLKNNGFSEPLIALSGNGVHLLYKIDLVNNDTNKKLMENILIILDNLFSDENVEVDRKVFNPSRICKLYGTVAKKGTDDKENDRPYRMAKIVKEPSGKCTKETLENLLNYLPIEDSPTYQECKVDKDFDLDDFLRKNNISVLKEESYKDGTKYVLEECPFDPAHGHDSAVFKLNNGALGFACFHNGCSGNHWKEFRSKYEPNYRNNIALPNHLNTEYKAFNVKDILDGKEKISDKVNGLLTPLEILNSNRSVNEFIPTGFKELDKYLGGGLQKTFLTVLSGLSGGGKSTFLNQLVLNIINDTNSKVVYYSGELTSQKLLEWLMLNAGGDYYKNVNGKRVLNYECRQAIAEWLNDRLYVYNNDLGHGLNTLSKVIVDGVEKYKADVIILDNLTSIDFSMASSYRNDKYDGQSKLVFTLKEIAKRCNVHIILVAHFRKSTGLARIEDMSGSGDIRNLADNVLLLHKHTDDFKKAVESQYNEIKNFIPSYEFKQGVDYFLEIAKERDNGNQGIKVDLYFNKETKRVLNDRTEKKYYGWEDKILDLPF